MHHGHSCSFTEMIGYGYYIILYIILIVLHYMFYINAKPVMKRNSRSKL